MDPYLPMLVSLESPPMKILLHEEHKIQRIPFPRRKKRPNGGVRGGERTHAGLAPSNSFVLLAMAGEIGAGLGLGFRLRGGAVEFGRGKTRAHDNGVERFIWRGCLGGVWKP